MFDIGFSELMLVAVVALVVIGPERLPALARTLGHLFGRLQRYVNDVKADISREIELDELKKFKNQFEEAAQSVESGVRSEMAGAETTLESAAAEVNSAELGAALGSTPAAVNTDAAGEGVVAGPRVESGVEPGSEPAAPAEVAPADVSPVSGKQKTAV